MAKLLANAIALYACQRAIRDGRARAVAYAKLRALRPQMGSLTRAQNSPDKEYVACLWNGPSGISWSYLPGSWASHGLPKRAYKSKEEHILEWLLSYDEIMIGR